MQQRALTSVAAVLSMVLLQSCATSGQQAEVVTSEVDLVSLSVEPELDTLTEGDSVRFNSGLLSPLGQVTIGRAYIAASGRRCKRILSDNGEELISVICKAADSRWYMRQLS